MKIPEDIAEALCQEGYDPTLEGVNEYFHDLANSYDLSYEEVLSFYRVYGITEIFDGVVAACEDMAGGY